MISSPPKYDTLPPSMSGTGVFFMQTWGHITERKARSHWCVRGKWQGRQWYFSQIPTIHGFIPCKTKDLAKILQDEISKEIERGTFNPARYSTARPLHLKEFTTEWLKRVKPTLPFSTWRGYRTYISHYINPILGDVFIPDLNYNHYLRIWVEVKKSEKYRKNILACIYTMMEDARRSGHLAQVPEKIVFQGKFKIPKKKKLWIDRPTQEAILNEIRTEDRPLFQFIFITGVRPSEARALQKADIYQDQGHITIRWTFAPVENGGERLKEVKQKEERNIPFYDALIPVIGAVQTNLTPFVFVNPRTGQPYTKNINRDIWDPASKKALGYVIPLNNAGRHSWGNQMARAGLDMESIRSGLGHSTTKTTRDFYADPALNVLKKAVDNVRALKTSFVPALNQAKGGNESD